MIWDVGEKYRELKKDSVFCAGKEYIVNMLEYYHAAPAKSSRSAVEKDDFHVPLQSLMLHEAKRKAHYSLSPELFLRL